MIVIIAEKPSVGREIARVMNITGKGEGYLHGNGYAVTWAYGHLVGLALPGDYGYERPQASDLPMLPEPWKLIVRRNKTAKGYETDATANKQLRVIKKLFDGCESIVVATDAGREGELIFRYIYEHCKCKKPFQRLWISSLTDTAIRAGFENLRPGAQFDDLYRAADCQAKADWLVGINASQALRIATGTGNNSLGRVQTPTLAMVCARWLEHTNFTPGKYWKLSVLIQKKGQQCRLTSVKEFETKEDADKAYAEIKKMPEVHITKVAVKKTRQRPPLLYDLTALQKDAATLHDFTAERTLQVAQQLYEHKLITYPRTGSRYIPDDVAATVPDLLYRVLSMPEYAHCTEIDRPCGQSVDGAKVTDHHALLTTGLDPAALEGDQRKIYCLIAGRMLEAFSADCVKEVGTVEAAAGGIRFAATASRILTPGWRAVHGRAADASDDEADSSPLPPLAEGETLTAASQSLSEKLTTAKPLYTEATLLGAMENAGRKLEDKAQRDAMADTGLGTPATRAAVIATLVAREYIERNGKNIIPTGKGMALYKGVKALMVADPAMTGEWEKTLAGIGRGEYDPATFMQAIGVHTRQVTSEILQMQVGPVPGAPTFTCPKCAGKVTLHQKIARCNTAGCGLVVFRKFLNKTLTDEHFAQLFADGRTDVIEGFEGKRRVPFPARIKFDERFNATFEYADDGKPKKSPAKAKKTE